jgi:arylsulfatase A-like enzyme
MNKTRVVALLLAACFLCVPGLSLAQPPNIVVIMLDDIDERGMHDMLAEGLLPEIQEHIVGRAVEFSNAFTTEAICCPSRATFLSGQYPHNNGIEQNFALYDALPGVTRPMVLEGDPGVIRVPESIPDDKVMLGAIGRFDDSNTIATRLDRRGYITGHVGKYLHGYGGHRDYVEISPTFSPRYVPPGWDHWATLVDPTTYCVYDYVMNVDGQVLSYDRPEGVTESDELYQTQVLSDFAAAFVTDNQDAPQPFYLQIELLTPHAEVCADAYAPDPAPGSGYGDRFRKKIRVPPQDAGRYVPTFTPRGAFDDDNSDKPDYLVGITSLYEDDRAALLEVQYENRMRSMYSVDRLVGALFDALTPEEAENTLVIFTSDNGWLNGEHRLVGKQAPYDESIGIPLYVRYPGRTEPAVSDAIVINTDFAPTILELTGYEYQPREFDGTSFAPFVVDPARTDTPKREQFLVTYFAGLYSDNAVPSYLAVRTQDVLYVESDRSEFTNLAREELVGLEYYDLVADPFQANSIVRLGQGDVPGLYPQLVDRLAACRSNSCRFWEYYVFP